MPEPTVAEQNKPVHPPTTTSRVPEPAVESDHAKMLKAFIAACSVAMIGCFFLPWIRFLIGTPSGYQIQQLPSDQAKLVWVIPGASALTLFALASKQRVPSTACLAGLTPFLALAYYLNQFGSNLLNAFQIGAYGTFILGAILCLLAAWLSRAKS